MNTAAYPRELETDIVLRDGSTIRVRPVRATDRDGLLAFLEALSPESMVPLLLGGGTSQAATWAADVDYAAGSGSSRPR